MVQHGILREVKLDWKDDWLIMQIIKLYTKCPFTSVPLRNYLSVSPRPMRTVCDAIRTKVVGYACNM
jgi:hypothetical protein